MVDTENNSGFRQEMPPPGGYRPFNWHRTFPKVFWRPGLMCGALAFCAVYGYYEANARKRHLMTEKFEDTDIQNAMEPFLKAERDREWLKFLKRNRDLENEIMKDVPGWKTGTWYGEPVYFTLGDKWWDPGQYEVYIHSTSRRRTNDFMWRHRSDYDGPLFWDKWVPDIGAKYRDSLGWENVQVNPYSWKLSW